ncbi:hypothetical protein H4R20_007249, partial [Coemansia guatemalensis]
RQRQNGETRDSRDARVRANVQVQRRRSITQLVVGEGKESKTGLGEQEEDGSGNATLRRTPHRLIDAQELRLANKEGRGHFKYKHGDRISTRNL